MTIKECIDIVDNAKPNQYSIKEKVMWLSFVDETIINDVLKTHEGYDGRYDDFKGYTEDKLSVPLIVPSPYDRLYPQYIKMMIDSENGETARYNNSAALYNTYLNEYKKYYNKTHMPLNATQKIPSPVSININSALSEAQIEYIKRQLYYMLSQDVGEVISPDKLYDIVTNYVLNNLEMIRANDGKDGKDGKDGTMICGFYSGLPRTIPAGVRYNNAPSFTPGAQGLRINFSIPFGCKEKDLLLDGNNGLLFRYDGKVVERWIENDGSMNVVSYDVITVLYNMNGKDGALAKDDYGNIGREDNVVRCMAYYIKSIDLANKKIYLSNSYGVPEISTKDNKDSSFDTPAYDIGDKFSIINNNHYNSCGTITAVENNVITYSEDSLGFDSIIADTDANNSDYTFRVYNKPDIGVVCVTGYAFAVGKNNKALGAYSVAEGYGNVADGFHSHAEGRENYTAYTAHAEGYSNKAVGNESHAEGHRTTASGGNAHAEGQQTTASGGGSHAEGMGTNAVGSQSHAEGLNTTAKGAQSHSEGVSTQANSFSSHVEGNGSIANAAQAHAEGYQTIASGQSSHSEGQQTEASGTFAHAQGIRTYAKGYAAFTSGADTEASEAVAVAMGKSAKATARASFAMGESVTASGSQSVAMGYGTTAKQQAQAVVGKYNADNADALFIVGNGSASARSNAFVVDKSGNAWCGGNKVATSDDIARLESLITQLSNKING